MHGGGLDNVIDGWLGVGGAGGKVSNHTPEGHEDKQGENKYYDARQCFTLGDRGQRSRGSIYGSF